MSQPPSYYSQFLSHHSHNLSRKDILVKLMRFPDQNSLNFESCLFLLKHLGIIRKLNGVQHIQQIVDTHRSATNRNQNQFDQCMLVHCLWEMIGGQQIDVRQFKEIIIILSNTEDQEERISQLFQIYGQCEVVATLVELWDQICGDSHHSSENELFEPIEDISIIGRQRQIEQNSQNNPNHINSRRFPQSITEKQLQNIRYRSHNQSLSFDEQSKLIDRLYKFDIYKQRQEKKKLLEEQRRKEEMKQCSFNPRVSSHSSTRVKAQKGKENQIKGFESTVNRLKKGFIKQKELKQDLQLRNGKTTTKVSYNYEIRPPKFTEKIKTDHLFVAKFTLNKNRNITLKIRQSDTIQELIERVNRIFKFKKQQEFLQMRMLLEGALNQFYNEFEKEQCELYDQ